MGIKFLGSALYPLSHSLKLEVSTQNEFVAMMWTFTECSHLVAIFHMPKLKYKYLMQYGHTLRRSVKSGNGVHSLSVTEEILFRLLAWKLYFILCFLKRPCFAAWLGNFSFISIVTFLNLNSRSQGTTIKLIRSSCVFFQLYFL